jgi:hypothetical protein
MANTYQLIEAQTLGSSAASVTFSAIPATYTDLVAKFSIRQTAAFPFSTVQLKFNGSTTSFTVKYLEGDGAIAASGASPARYVQYANASTSTANTFSNGELYIPNYAGSNYKSHSIDAVSEQNAATAYTDLVAGLWSNTAAITQLDFIPASGNFAQYSTFYLYGIKNS